MYIIERDPAIAQRVIEMTNIKTRHCKIGKVHIKPPKGWGGIPNFSIQPPYRDTTGWPPIAPWMMPSHWCNTASHARR